MPWKEQQLKRALDGLSSGERRWFAAAAAARVLQNARDRGGAAADAITALEAAINVLLEPIANESALRNWLQECEQLIQDEDADDYDSNPVLDNAVSAVCYALEAALGDSDAAFWTASQAYEAADYIAHTELDADFNDPAQMAQVEAHPRVVAELSAQAADLQMLASSADPTAMVRRIRGPSGA